MQYLAYSYPVPIQIKHRAFLTSVGHTRTILGAVRVTIKCELDIIPGWLNLWLVRQSIKVFTKLNKKKACHYWPGEVVSKYNDMGESCTLSYYPKSKIQSGIISCINFLWNPRFFPIDWKSSWSTLNVWPWPWPEPDGPEPDNFVLTL